MEDKEKAIQRILKQIQRLPDSTLVTFRKQTGGQPVVGEGSLNAKIMFVGEAPGENEAKTGKPFCGRSGKVLDALLASANLKREKVYITSIVKDRPPKNRNPKPDEIECYAKFLDKQIEIIKPKVIATLGKFGMEYIMRRYGLEDEIRPISQIHGRVFKTNIEGQNVKIVALYHPASMLYSPKLKEALMEDFQVLKNI